MALPQKLKKGMCLAIITFYTNYSKSKYNIEFLIDNKMLKHCQRLKMESMEHSIAPPLIFRPSVIKVAHCLFPPLNYTHLDALVSRDSIYLILTISIKFVLLSNKKIMLLGVTTR